MLEQFGTGALDELDYTGEAYNAFRLSKNMESIPNVHIPVIYPDLSTPKVLTMEFIQGTKISNVERIRAAGLDTTEIARNAFRAIIKQVLIDGFFHADPHPGNILVNLQTGVITFIDTGMVGELDVQSRVNIGQLMLAVQQADVNSMAQIMRDLSVPFAGPVDDQAYYKDFERKIGRYIFEGSRMSFSQAVGVAFDLMREHGLRLDPNLTLAIKALMQAEAFTSVLDPNGNVVNEGVAMIRELLITPATADMLVTEVKKQVTLTGRELVKRIPNLSEATLRWVDQYQKGRFEVFVNTSDLSREVDKVARLGQQISVGILLAGIVIGSSIAISLMILGRPVIAATGLFNTVLWDLVYRVAAFAFLAAMLIGFMVLLRQLWNWLRGRPIT
jgi:ubiquinone biosynthesis protein